MKHETAHTDDRNCGYDEYQQAILARFWNSRRMAPGQPASQKEGQIGKSIDWLGVPTRANSFAVLIDGAAELRIDR